MAASFRPTLSWLVTIISGLLLFISSSAFATESNNASRQLPLRDVQNFTTAISQIKNYYVKPVDDKALFEDAIRGMLVGLDPHSTYLDEEDFKELRASTKGEFSGLGIEVTMENGLIKVITPIDDTPAAKAGIKSGDYIVRIDKHPVKGMTLRDAVTKMRGKSGSEITLTILRKGAEKPLTFTLKRETIQIKSVKKQLLENKYGYVRISHFQATTAKDMEKAIKTLKKDAGGKLQGLILDLRNNPGGLLDSAIDVSDAFIHNDKKGKEELIVYTKGRLPGSQFTARANPGDILNGAPIVVIINEGSASGSEIVAGALKDHKRAILIGTRTFGKGSVQTVLPLDTNRGIKLTTALYYTPAGVSIQAKGVEPDILVKNIVIPEGKDNEVLASLKEADLAKHLGNGDDKAKQDKLSVTDHKLLHKDYQLFEALNLLKGMTILTAKGSPQ